MGRRKQDETVTREEILKIYHSPGHPAAYSSPDTVYRFFQGRASRDQIKRALEHDDAYTLHREYKKAHRFNPYFVYHRRRQFQADLIDISSLKRANRGVTFLLVIIDVFSRRIWVYPLKNKSARETRRGFEQWFRALHAEGGAALSKIPGRSLLTDSGKEFVNAEVKAIMQSKGIRMDQAKNINKAAIVERVNKSLQILIYKYLTDRSETRYIDALPDLVKSYNTRKHRSLNYISPQEADFPSNEHLVRSMHRMRYSSLVGKQRKSPPTFKVGDMVRVKTYAKAPSSARRAYLQQFHGEYFKVVRLNRRMPIVMYEIQSMDTDEIIEGGFYSNELTRVRGDTFKIERIIKSRGTGPNKEHLVRWKHFGPRWDSWIKASDVLVEAK